MNYLRILLSLALMLAAFNCISRTNVKKETDASFRLNLQAPIDKWNEAIPLGNGLTGGLLWGSGNEIRLSLDPGNHYVNDYYSIKQLIVYVLSCYFISLNSL